MTVTATDFFACAPWAMSPVAEDRFFSDLQTGNRTFKRTAADRFAELDPRCVHHFARTCSSVRAVLDIGVSSGTTTLALHDRLVTAGHSPRTTGTDLSFDAWLVPVATGIRALIDAEGHPLQHDVMGFAVRPWIRRLDYVSGMALFRHWLNSKCRNKTRDAAAPENREGMPLRLISHRFAHREDVCVEANDIFEFTPHLAGNFDFIRAANILNLGYFDNARLQKALGNIVRYLSGPGAWLLLARTGDRGHDATLFRLSPDGRRLRIVERMGQGSEIEHLALRALSQQRQAWV